MSEPTHCAVCGARLRRAKPWLFACESCSFLASTLQPGPGTEMIGLEALRKANIAVCLDRLERQTSLRGLTVLDVGCSNGLFLEAALARGAIVRGIEPEAVHVQASRAKGLPVDHGFFPQDLGDRGPYDIVAFNDVFEHLPSPDRAIGEVERLLKPGGHAMINLPSRDGVLYRLATVMDAAGFPGPFERLWQKGFPSPHVSYFSPATLRGLVERHSGLRQIDAFPLQSFKRDRLWERVSFSTKGLAAYPVFTGLWGMSFVMPLLPADLHVGVFTKAG